MYSCQKSEKFQQHVQTSLSQKPQPFLKIFIGFLESTQIFADLKKNIMVIA